MKYNITLEELLKEINTCIEAGQSDDMILSWINVLLNEKMDVKK
jgi:hypothetical protein